MSTPDRATLPTAGDTIAGRYRVGEVLGSGGMGTVLAAECLTDGEPVAIKVLRVDRDDRDGRKRFAREARAVGAIDSLHVAKVREVGELGDGTPFMVMELLIGETLAAVIRDRAPLPVEEAVDWILQACEGVAEAHALGIIHRDLKPSNLFVSSPLDDDSLLKVLDFGIAKATIDLDTHGGATALTKSNALLGSPRYMSPEQLRSAKHVDERTDIWALGLVLHELLTGQPAFNAESLGTHFAMVMTDPPEPLQRRRPGAPAKLEAVILRCLKKDVAERHRNVAALAEALVPFGGDGAAERAARIREILASGPASASSLEEQTLDATTRAAPMPPQAQWDDDEEAPRSARRWSRPVLAAIAAAAVIGAAILLLQRAPETSVGSDAPLETTGEAATARSTETLAPQVEIALRVEPTEARIELDGEPLDGDALRLPDDGRSHTLLVQAPGYAPQRRSVSSSTPSPIQIVLDREAPPPARSVGRTPPALAPPSTAAPSPSEAEPSPDEPPSEPSSSPIKPKGPLEATL